MSLKNLKAGDKVFVVHQLLRGQTEVRTEWAVVVKVGRKFGYLDRDAAFDLVNGQSHHGRDEYNARCNGNGFDVYLTEKEYRKKIEERGRFLELSRELCGGTNYWSLLPLDPATVKEIREILDRVAK